MTQAATYIRKIEIAQLWNRSSHVMWNLSPTVNILSGVNGVGKSTILNRLIQFLEKSRGQAGTPVQAQMDVHITFSPEEATYVKYDVIRSFDRPFVAGDAIHRLGETHIYTELDWQLYLLQRRYLDYQVNLGNRMIRMLTDTDPTAQAQATQVASIKAKFQDIVDRLFQDTNKYIDRTSNEIRFVQSGEHIYPYQLSSGEKQMLVILLTVLTQDMQPYVLLMDEPEISLHIEWQQQLINILRELNPAAQIILTTHSPAVIMNGWLDAVTDVADILD